MGFGVGIILSALTAGVAEAATGYRPGQGVAVPVAVTVADLVGLWAGLLGAVLWWSRARGSRSVVSDFGLRVGAWWDVPLGVAVGLASQYGLVPLIYLPFEHLDRHLSHELGRPAQQDVAAAHSVPAVAVLVVFLAVGAPVVEELFFRGLLLRSVAAWTGPVVAVVASGLLFGLAHFQAVQLAGLAAFGMVLGALAWRTGRLAPSMAAHMSFNAVAVLAAVHLR